MPVFQSIQLGSAALSASAQYAQWATDLGVSTTATLQALDGDDSNWAFTLASPCLVAGASNAEFSSEGMVGWSRTTKLNQPVSTDFTRMYYAGGVQPDMLWAFRFNADCRSVGVKLQKASGVTILGGTIGFYSGSSQKIDFAVRFSDVLTSAPQVVITVSPGASAAKVGALRVAPDSVNFSSASVSAGQTVSLTVTTTPLIAVGTLPEKRGAMYLGPQGRQPGAPIHKSGTVLRAWKNVYYGGTGVIQGIVTIENVPGSRKVRLFDRRTGMIIGETWSSPSGNYEFPNVDSSREYFVVAHDHLRVYNAVVQDMLVP